DSVIVVTFTEVSVGALHERGDELWVQLDYLIEVFYGGVVLGGLGERITPVGEGGRIGGAELNCLIEIFNRTIIVILFNPKMAAIHIKKCKSWSLELARVDNAAAGGHSDIARCL